MKIPQILSVLVLLAATVSAVPNLPAAHNAKRQVPTNPAEAKPIESLPPSTGLYVKSRFFRNIPKDMLKEKVAFFSGLDLTVWNQLATLENKLAASMKAEKPDESLVNQIGNAWIALFNGQTPDFDKLPTTPPQSV
ncbi:hypothetical protein TWF281_001578 [Arthrobotrys megalospora]